LPECRLYDHLFHVADSTEDFVGSVRAILDAHSDDGRAAQRFDWARDHTCRRVVDRLLSWLPD
jgi:teichuronic acid biosynthesis glycosyltransferase TuaH